jgi:ribosomal protein S18 acetylase RimI-like enzyme
MLMARVDGQPAGIAGLHLETDEGDTSVGVVNGMYISRRYRRQGVGRRLLLALIDHLTEHPRIVTFRLWVAATEEPARRLYDSLGFRLVPESDQPDTGDASGRRLLIMERPARNTPASRTVDR